MQLAVPGTEEGEVLESTSQGDSNTVDGLGSSRQSASRGGSGRRDRLLQVGLGGITADEYRTQMSLWSLLAAPLIVTNDLRSMSEETRSILMNTEVITID